MGDHKNKISPFRFVFHFFLGSFFFIFFFSFCKFADNSSK